MTDDSERKTVPYWLLLIVVIFGVSAWLILGVIPIIASGSLEQGALIGDAYAFVGSFVGSIGLVITGWALLLNYKELNLQKQATKRTSEEMERAAVIGMISDLFRKYNEMVPSEYWSNNYQIEYNSKVLTPSIVNYMFKVRLYSSLLDKLYTNSAMGKKVALSDLHVHASMAHRYMSYVIQIWLSFEKLCMLIGLYREKGQEHNKSLVREKFVIYRSRLVDALALEFYDEDLSRSCHFIRARFEPYIKDVNKYNDRFSRFIGGEDFEKEELDPIGITRSNLMWEIYRFLKSGDFEYWDV